MLTAGRNKMVGILSMQVLVRVLIWTRYLEMTFFGSRLVMRKTSQNRYC